MGIWFLLDYFQECDTRQDGRHNESVGLQELLSSFNLYEMSPLCGEIFTVVLLLVKSVSVLPVWFVLFFVRTPIFFSGIGECCNAVLSMFSCEAPGLFCGLKNFTRLFIGKGGVR